MRKDGHGEGNDSGMTTTSDDLELAADFAPATYDDWRKLVDGVLKGAPFEKLVGKTSDGLKIDPIYRRAQGAMPIAGRAAAAPWQIMQRVDHPDAGRPTRRRCTISRMAPPGWSSCSPAPRARMVLGSTDAPKTLAQVSRRHLSRRRDRDRTSVGPQSREWPPSTSPNIIEAQGSIPPRRLAISASALDPLAARCAVWGVQSL